ncbi:MAG: AEC family transporter [Oscillospiraceae bacterium]|nr:AEC family transporter [Oscillospiraceae bacterium]
MLDLFTRADAFVAIIVLGIVLRKIGLFQRDDFRVLSNIVIKITLPAAIITSLSQNQIDSSMLALSLLGFCGGVLYMICGYLLNVRRSREEKAFTVLNLPGYNIGAFALPFCQSFLGPMGVVATCLFDTGNAFICLGTSYSIAAMIKDGRGFSWKSLLKALGTSVPFITYLVMLPLNLLRIPLPKMVLEFAGILSNANAFMAMLAIGVGFHLTAERSQLASVAKVLFARFSIAAILAAAYYFLLPFSLEIRQALVILAFSPIGSAVPPFTRQLGGDVGLSSAINSIAIVCSIIIMVTLLGVML